MRRVIVSGITGHLGRELAAQLSSAGIEVHGITRRLRHEASPDSHGGQLHRVDGTTETLVATFETVCPDTVFHLAAFSRRHHHVSDVIPLLHSNIGVGTQLLEAMRLTGCRRIIIAGSYLQHFGLNDSRAFNLYAATKQAYEAIVDYYIDAFELSAVRLTLSDIYSETDTRPKLMTDISVACASHTLLKLRGHEAWIDPVHVEDAAFAFLQANSLLESGALPCGRLSQYSVSSGRTVSATQLVALFETLGKCKLSVERGNQSNEPREMQPWRGLMLPGWAPRISLEEGVMRILQHCAHSR